MFINKVTILKVWYVHEIVCHCDKEIVNFMYSNMGRSSYVRFKKVQSSEKWIRTSCVLEGYHLPPLEPLFL